MLVRTKFIKRAQRLLEKVKVLRQVEDLSRQEMQNKLENLLQQKELKVPKDYKAYTEAEISHLRKILTGLQDIKKL